MKEVVSVSLGSSKRDHTVQLDLLGTPFTVRRMGADGDMKKAMAMLADLDGKVNAIGLGGIDLYLVADGKRYVIRDAAKMKAQVSHTPVVDGSGLKDTLEREAIRYLIEEAKLELRGKKVLMVSAVDRFGMAEALNDAGCELIYGDLIFGLGIPIPITNHRTFVITAKILLPIITKLPFKLLYPTGSKQDEGSKEKYGKYYRDSDIIAGDFHFIRKFMPKDMSGKWIITNTITGSDVEDLKSRGAELLVTTTPDMNGRSFGTNLVEAMFIAVLEKPKRTITADDHLGLLKKLGFKPRMVWLQKEQDAR